MVGVASSNLVAPTKFGRKIKHSAEMPGAFFSPDRQEVTFPNAFCPRLDSRCWRQNLCRPEQLAGLKVCRKTGSHVTAAAPVLQTKVPVHVCIPEQQGVQRQLPGLLSTAWRTGTSDRLLPSRQSGVRVVG